MNRFFGACVVGLCVFASSASWGRDQQPIRFQGFVEISPERELYVDWIKAQPGQPTVVLLNGMTYSTKYWDAMTEALIARGVGVFRYDMYGMGRTLLQDAGNSLKKSPFVSFEAMIYTALGLNQDMIDQLVHSPVLNSIRLTDQVKDLELLLEKVGLKDKLNILGLSYGGGVALEYAAQHPERINKLIPQAPYTEAMADQVSWIRQMMTWTRMMFPGNMVADRVLYDFWLRFLVYTTYPRVEPSVLDNAYKLEATFRLAQGATDWKASDIVAKLPEKTVHLMIAGDDQYIPRKVLEDLWASIPDKARASKTIVNSSEHKIPEAVPQFAAAWVYEILTGNPVIADGRAFDADPKTGVVRYEGGELKVQRRSEASNLRIADIASQERVKEIFNGAVQSAGIRCQSAHTIR